MWPWRKQPEASPLDAWSLNALESELHDVVCLPGEWVICDGARLDTSVSLGDLLRGDGRLRVNRGAGSLQSVVFEYPGTSAPEFDEIVIDSGYLVLCSKDAFLAGGITGRASAALLRDCAKRCPRADVVAAFNADGAWVGAVIAPPDGDGAYALQHQVQGKDHSLRIELEHSN